MLIVSKWVGRAGGRQLALETPKVVEPVSSLARFYNHSLAVVSTVKYKQQIQVFKEVCVSLLTLVLWLGCTSGPELRWQ